MSDIYVFADEAGNFDFSRGSGATRYFILTTVTIPDCSIGDQFLALRRELVWRGYELPEAFHAANDAQLVRDEVFALIQKLDCRIDATIFEKPKALPHLRSEHGLYKMAWYLHFKHVAPRIATKADRMMVTAASLGTKKKMDQFSEALKDVVQQVSTANRFKTAFWHAASEPCLQVADYCCWAIQRKWERGDDRSLKLIAEQVRTQKDIWRIGKNVYY